MNSDQPNSTGGNDAPQQPPAEKVAPTDLPNHEPALEKLYKELTGEDESQARNTFMFILGDKEEPPNPP